MGEASYLAECVRPWKLITLALGIALLIAGSYWVRAPDWDVPISVIMAVLSYLTAPWTLNVVLRRKWKLLPVALFFAWFTVDGCYAIYWHFRNPAALHVMRDANFLASLPLYFLCGAGWLYRGSLRDLIREIRAHLRYRR